MKTFIISNGNNMTNIINLEEQKKYLISEKEKQIYVSTNITAIDKGIQYELLQIAENNNPNSRYKYELEYIKDEKIDNKNCIFIKEKLFYKENTEYIELGNDSENDVRVYWIEKSTGFVIGSSTMQSDKNSSTPSSIIKNIKFGEVTDNDFELPNNYKIIERNF